MQLSLFKVCTKCNQQKLISEFSKDKYKSDGLDSFCKGCRISYYKENRDYLNEKAKQRAKTNRKKYGLKTILWRMLHPDKVKESKQREQKKHRDAYNKRNSKYAKNNRDKINVNQNNRYARVKGNGGTYTLDEWNALCEKYGHICLCCKEQKPLTVDHIIPVTKGGTSDIDNLQPLCQSCNSRKGNNVIDYR